MMYDEWSCAHEPLLAVPAASNATAFAGGSQDDDERFLRGACCC